MLSHGEFQSRLLVGDDTIEPWQDILVTAGFPTDVLLLDFESVFTVEYSLSKMSTVEYVRDPQFALTGLGYRRLNGTSEVGGFLPPDEAMMFLATLRAKYGPELSGITLAGQNLKYDALVLREHYGITARHSVDIIDLARHLDSRDRHDLAHLANKYGAPISKGETKQFLGLRWQSMTEEQRKELAEYCYNGDVQIETYLLKTLLPRLTWSSAELRLANQTLRQFLIPRIKIDMELGERLIVDMSVELQKPVDAVNALGVRVVEPGKRTGRTRRPPAVRQVTAADVSKDSAFLSLLKSALPEGESIPMKQGKARMIPALAKTDTQCDYLLSHPSDKVRLLMEARKAADSWPTHISRVRNLMAQAAARGGYLGAPLVYFGAHCMPGEAEVLTRSGWLPLRAWRAGEIVQWRSDGTMSFCPATNNAFFIDEECVRVSAPYLRAVYTKGHTIPRFGSGAKQFMPCEAGMLLERSVSYLPIGGLLLQPGSITPSQIRLLVAVQADGHWQMSSEFGRELRFELTKSRKQKRIRQLLADTQIPYRECAFPSRPGEVTFRIRYTDCPGWLLPERKIFGPWLLRASTDAMIAFIGELVYWDGHSGATPEYYSKLAANHEWVRTIAHLTGIGASTCKDGWRTTLRKTRSPGMTTIAAKHCAEERYTGMVYCPSTETGYWLVRYEGAIHVTGNTGRWSGTGGINFQNFGARDVHDLIKQVGQMLTAPEGYVFGTGDLSQIEARIAAWFAGQEDLLESFRQYDRKDGKDIYCSFAEEQIYHKETRKPREDDPPELAKALTTRRNVGKETILGAGFGMGGNTFYERCKQKPSLKKALASGELTFELCQRAIAVYRKRFSLIPVFWRELEKAWRFVARYKDQQAVVSHQGRTLRFWNEGGTVVIQLPSSRCLFYPHAAVGSDDTCRYRWGHVYGGSLTENVVQATARDIFALGLLRMEDAGMDVLMTVHDQAVCLFQAGDAGVRLKEMHALQCEVPAWAEGLPIATEGDLTKAYHKI